ncbi:hypothetical protein AGABI1DRAFT_81244 [Agaricus bisporus var. burnettii JB137-S8]|uniref:TMEM205-like domain-containing protein n=1 Tax=Agaricus bisporus var. burnettii (strain JB137-S8 / ATCC MYA-4627 / FGSC 10392) TaxID=597362 RepID=K5W9D0_AGABU|nr:uncharacterized protein AGABI1DRAFT_81244 [Agaricus bisporus var. burnettii JB137-S8]EKM83479.1 hypothetical protein AGABI1DRAFT_81244 [Agaricus bisporus var. burnettii JB137-S8]
MAQTDNLTLGSIFHLANIADGLYMLGYAWLFGMSLWVTFFGAIISLKALPRQYFGTLQHRVFPVYFLQSVFLSSALLTKWIYTHPGVLNNLSNPYIGNVAQVYALGLVLACQGCNRFIVIPQTSSIKFQRQKLEKKEGKEYNDPIASAEMKALNRRFMSLHGISSLANLTAVIALGIHGLWIGTAGAN